MENTSIGWTHHSMNFWWGCNKVNAMCRRCYIGPIMKRGGHEPFQGPMATTDWSNPERWDRKAGKAGVRERVFTCSMSDFFHDGADAWRTEAWGIIKACENLDWLILTKRPHLVLDRLPADWGRGYPNVWLGVSCGCAEALPFLDHLRVIPAVLKFVSAEPLLEPMDFRPHLGWLDWVITGCERARKGDRVRMSMDWVRDIDGQCREAGKPHFFKQAYPLDEDGEEFGVPCEEPPLDGTVVQDVPPPSRRLPLAAL